jgi:hypothetical protein
MLQAGRSPVRVPDDVNVFNWPNPSRRTMALGSTQPLTEMSTRNIPGGRIGLTTLPPSVNRMSENMGASTSRNPKGLQGLYRDNFTCLPLQLNWYRSTLADIHVNITFRLLDHARVICIGNSYCVLSDDNDCFFFANTILYRIWYSDSGDYEEFYLAVYNPAYFIENQLTSWRKMLVSSTGPKNRPSKRPAWDS